MKKLLKFFGFMTLVMLILFSAVTCGSSGSNPNPDPDPEFDYSLLDAPEVAVIPGKTVFEYFSEEGIKLGWNLGNTLDAILWDNPSASTEGSFNPTNNPAREVVFTGIKSLGVDIVRIPVTWTGFTGPAPDYTLSTARLARVAEVIGWAHSAGLKVIINLHHDGANNPYTGSKDFGWLKTGFHASDPNRGNNAEGTISNAYKEMMYDRFHKVWKQIAEYFKDYDEWLIFQSMNEVHDGTWYDFSSAEYTILNELNQLFSNTVRATGSKNATRYLMLACQAAKPDALTDNRYKLPVDSSGPGRQIVTFHTYDPYDFAHNAIADWSGNQSEIDNILTPFKAKFIDSNIPVIIGEMGPRWNGNTSATRQANRLAYISYVYGKAHELGLIPVYWDDGGNFQMINRSTGQPRDDHAAASFAAMRTAVGK